MKIYTKTGDAGETGLLGGERVRKNDRRIAAIGAIDELNAAIGIAIACGIPAKFQALTNRIQCDLFELGAELADARARREPPRIGPSDVSSLESEIDAIENELPELTNFILPGGSLASAQLHFARAVCRSAERAVVELLAEPSQTPSSLVYLNRLGDLLFVLARGANRDVGQAEVEWTPSK